jgi:hypothetical protein
MRYLLFSFLSLSLGLIPAISDAELRVFRLAITNAKTGQSRSVMSNLDNIQYPGYHHVKPDETVTIQETWMCRKRSDVSQDPTQKYCANPRGPASLTPSAVPSSSPLTGSTKP